MSIQILILLTYRMSFSKQLNTVKDNGCDVMILPIHDGLSLIHKK
jgi:hypothetical protein